MTEPTLRVPMFEYRGELAAQREDILQAVADVLDSGTLILGPRVRRFEEKFAEYLSKDFDRPLHCIGTANGTDALALALRAVGIGPGDEVLTVANTAIPTVAAIRMTGAAPVFCDIDPETLLFDVSDAVRRITPRCKALLPVHLFGNAVAMTPLLEFAESHGLRVVEDCAQATGTTYLGRRVGTFGDIGCFSFYPTKNLGAFGDGGCCVTADPVVADTLRRLRTYGCAGSYHALQEGVNSRLDELQAAILEVKLTRLDAAVERRRSIAAMYDRLLGPHLLQPQTTSGAEHGRHLYVVESERREDLILGLREAGIGFGIHYPTPIHRMQAYEFLGYAAGALPVTERCAERILSLPCYPGLSDEAVHLVAEIVNQIEAAVPQ